MKMIAKTAPKKPVEVALKSWLQNENRSGLTAFDFLLAPAAFVERCAAVFLVKPEHLPAGKAQQLADAIQSGRPRFDIVDLMCSTEGLDDTKLKPPGHKPAAMDTAPFISTDILGRFSPDNNEMFVVEVYHQAAGRLPSSLESAEGCSELKRGLITRKQYIEKTKERFATSRPSPKLATPFKLGFKGAPGIVDAHSGSKQFTFVRNLGSAGWLIEPNTLLQPVDLQTGEIKAHEGWLLVGQTGDLEHGRWALDIDIVQPANVRLMVEVVANSGLDKLVSFEISGSCVGAFCFYVAADHHFIEAKIYKPKQGDAFDVLTIRNFSVSKQVNYVLV